MRSVYGSRSCGPSTVAVIRRVFAELPSHADQSVQVVTDTEQRQRLWADAAVAESDVLTVSGVPRRAVPTMVSRPSVMAR